MFFRITLRRSVFLTIMQWLFHCSALLALFFTSAPHWLLALFALLIVMSATRSRFFRMGAEAIIFTETSSFLIMTGATVECVLESECHCTEWLQVLLFRERGVSAKGQFGLVPSRQFRVILAPDSANSQSLRRLRVLLRWYHFPSAMLRR